jgi:hypothetical protein
MDKMFLEYGLILALLLLIVYEFATGAPTLRSGTSFKENRWIWSLGAGMHLAIFVVFLSNCSALKAYGFASLFTVLSSPSATHHAEIVLPIFIAGAVVAYVMRSLIVKAQGIFRVV